MINLTNKRRLTGLFAIASICIFGSVAEADGPIDKFEDGDIGYHFGCVMAEVTTGFQCPEYKKKSDGGLWPDPDDGKILNDRIIPDQGPIIRDMNRSLLWNPFGDCSTTKTGRAGQNKEPCFHLE